MSDASSSGIDTPRIDALDVDALGVRVRIEFPAGASDEFVDEARCAWSGATFSAHGTPDRTVVLPEINDEQYELERLSVSVTLEALDQRRGEMLLFHAAGAATPAGDVVAFVGPSGRGKTTLSTALCRHYGYVSDETIAVDAARAVHPYRKPLSVVRAGAPKKQVSPSDAGLQDLPHTRLRLAGLVLIERDAAAIEPEIIPLTFAEAIGELVPQMSYLGDSEHPLQRLAGLVDEIGGVVRLRYAEAESVVPLVPALADSNPVPATWSPSIQWRPGPFAAGAVDAIRVDDAVIVLADRHVQVLSGIAPEIWEAARSGADRAGITSSVVALHGEPEGQDADELVSRAVDELITAGVLRLSR